MSEKFVKKWGETGEYQPPFTTRVKEAVRPPGPLKPRLDFAIRRIEVQVQRLDQAADRFSERDKSIFARIVEAYSKHDTPRANAYANELAEIRKMEKTIAQARLALEQIVLRLKTVTELGDAMSVLAPVVGVLRSIRTGIAGILPDAGRELEQIGTMLSGIIMEAGQSTGFTLNFEATNEDAQRILSEAATVAEQRMKDKFPELPAGIPAVSEKAQTQT